MKAIRLLIVDDVAQVREDLRTALNLAGGIDIIGEAADGREALDLAAQLRPEVILMDLEMPVMNGYEAARQIKAHSPTCRVVALTVHGDEEAREKALQAGIDAFMVKGAALEELVRAVTER